MDWAATAAPHDQAAAQNRAIVLALNDDRTRKTQEILALERQIAACLVRTPYILLLSFPGINVVSAADYAGEMGPIGNSPTDGAITGRAGLFPSRYQSDRVDHTGPLVGRANRADFGNDDSQRIGLGESAGAQVFAIGFKNRTNLLHHVARPALSAEVISS